MTPAISGSFLASSHFFLFWVICISSFNVAKINNKKHPSLTPCCPPATTHFSALLYNKISCKTCPHSLSPLSFPRISLATTRDFILSLFISTGTLTYSFFDNPRTNSQHSSSLTSLQRSTAVHLPFLETSPSLCLWDITLLVLLLFQWSLSFFLFG